MFRTLIPFIGEVGGGLEEIQIKVNDKNNFQAFNDNNSTDLWDEVLISMEKEFNICHHGFDYDRYDEKYMYIHVPKEISKKEINNFLNIKCIDKRWHNCIKKLQTLVTDTLKDRKYLVDAIINHVNEKKDLSRTRVIMKLCSPVFRKF